MRTCQTPATAPKKDDPLAVSRHKEIRRERRYVFLECGKGFVGKRPSALPLSPCKGKAAKERTVHHVQVFTHEHI